MDPAGHATEPHRGGSAPRGDANHPLILLPHLIRLSRVDLSRLGPLLRLAPPSRRQCRLVLPLVLLLMVAVAVAQIDENPPPEAGTALEPSNCYRCHGSGIGMGLTSLYSISASSTTPRLDAPLQLNVTVRNDWVAELRDLSARIDLADAPDIGFTGRPPPVLGIERRGNLTFDALDPSDLVNVTQERTTRLEMPLPAGATALRIRLIPEGAGDDAPNLELRLWPPATDTRGDPALVIDEAGRGGTETLRVPTTTSTLRSGVWLAEVAQAPCDPLADRSCLRDQAFSLLGDAWFNITGGARQQTRPLRVLDGQDLAAPQTASVGWTLYLREAPEGNQTIRVLVNTTAHFKHNHNSARYDDWPFTQNLSLPIRLGGGVEVLAAPVEAAPESTHSVVLHWSESLGYAAAFALLASIVSGGAFGRASKRAVDRLVGGARRRVAFHIVLSYLLTVVAVAHTVVFLLEVTYHWSVGLLWGGLALLFMVLVGANGALQLPIIRAWGYPAWKFLNQFFTWALVLALLLHMGLDGANFDWLQDRVGWRDPVVTYFRG